MIHVFYHNDLDGKCGAAIIKRFWLSSEVWWSPWDRRCRVSPMNFIECDYKNNLSNHIDKIVAGDIVVIVDFSFKPPVMERVVSIVGVDNIYWFDHHKTAFDYNYGFIPKGIRNTNFSGCELAWRFLLPDKAIPKGVILIGDYDIWTHRYGELTENYYLGLQLFNNDPSSKDWDYYVLGEDDSEERINRVAEMGRTCKIYSSREDIDCGKIAQKYGGGGHPGAAGISCKELPFKIDIEPKKFAEDEDTMGKKFTINICSKCGKIINIQLNPKLLVLNTCSKCGKSTPNEMPEWDTEILCDECRRKQKAKSKFRRIEL